MHEHKTCPRCQSIFECKVGNIATCHCLGINFSEEERKLIEDKYKDCLCHNCLLELKNRYIMFQEKMFWK